MRQLATAKYKSGHYRSNWLKVRQIALPLHFVAVKPEPPSFATQSKLTTQQARGKSYERKVIKAVAAMLKAGDFPLDTSLHVGPWINYVDDSGPGLCQPDLVLVTPTTLLIIEVKLKQSEKAPLQLALYSPLCSNLWPRPTTLLLQAFKFPTMGKTSHWVDSPSNFLDNPAPQVHHWHYIP